MNLSKKSKLLMTFFTKNECINHHKQTDKTKHVLLELYGDILEAHEYISSLKRAKGSQFYNISIKHIHTASQIIKPKNFNSNSFPLEIRNHIDEMSFSELSYTFSLFDKEIKLIFITEDNVEDKIETYNKYVDTILTWIYILNQYSSKLCAKTFTVYFYFTSLEKKLPNSSVSVLDEIHINTAFTTTCPRDSEIVIYRKEEWFKVFMHETFHNFGLDFSDMNNDGCSQDILNIFPVDSKVNLYESYAEFWAEIMNALFCSFLKLKNKKNAQEFLLNAEFFINFERTHSFFQLVKTLRFMGLQYKDLYLKTKRSKILRETMYKEETNVLSYYVIKTILMNNYQGFLSWCNINNLSLLQFKKTPANLKEFCNFIEKNYKTQSMTKGVETTESLFNHLNNSKKASHEYIITNLRMSICELG
jgi:hypothetical protein